mmetsp:Transcript_11124/g.16061  ORF Transcript_11124/g.16061 Transcript_11124/m.16061 type:complete len:491 (-) Transcript_11124:61-1533(-)
MRPRQSAVIDKETALRLLAAVNLRPESRRFAIDIGGSLAKLLYVQRTDETQQDLGIKKLEETWPGAQLSVRIPEIGVILNFFAFETRNINDLVKFLKENWGSGISSKDVRATGGGAVKYAENFREELAVVLQHLDEMDCLVRGLNFLLTKAQKEVYIFDHEPLLSAAMSEPASPSVFPDLENSRKFVDASKDPFPYLLVNIGSGVSIIKVNGFEEYERVSGSSLGGGTFWGLSRLLTNCKTFDEVIELTKSGNNSKVDMLVGDIYGGEYGKVGLDASVIAASFGKVVMKKEVPDVYGWAGMWKQFVRAIKGTSYLWLNFLLSTPALGQFLRWMGYDKKTQEKLANLGLRSAFSANDVALSLLRMVAFNIGQIAYLNSKRYDVQRIYFGGNFIRDHPYTLAAISFAVRFWSNGETQAFFLQHDGFLGVIGAFLGNDDYDFVNETLRDSQDGTEKLDSQDQLIEEVSRDPVARRRAAAVNRTDDNGATNGID